MDTNIKYYHSPTDMANIKDFILIIKKLKCSPETIAKLCEDLHYVEEEHYPDGTWSPSSDLDKVWSSRFNRSDLLPLPPPTMSTEIEIKSEAPEATTTPEAPTDTKPDMKKQLGEKVCMMAEKLWASPEAVAMLKKDFGLTAKEETPAPAKEEKKPASVDDATMEMLKQFSNQ